MKVTDLKLSNNPKVKMGDWIEVTSKHGDKFICMAAIVNVNSVALICATGNRLFNPMTVTDAYTRPDQASQSFEEILDGNSWKLIESITLKR